MKAPDAILLLVLGLMIWIAGTIYYAKHGPAILETTSLRYWLAFAVSPIVSAALCIAILQWRHIAAAHWASAMLLLALPGMIGEAVVLSHLSTFMPSLQESSGGRYGAFLFATYAVALGVAEAVTVTSKF
jgi:ABC-type iron transport system FetAB permease component